MTVYRYATLYREPGLGAVPRNGLFRCYYDRLNAPSGHSAWGSVDYTRKLTDKEIADYELEYIGEFEMDMN